MTEEQVMKKEGAKKKDTKREQVMEELSKEDLQGLSGGVTRDDQKKPFIPYMI